MEKVGADILCYSDLKGQSRAKESIAKAIGRDRLAHAYLFRGPDGVGKKLFARGVAAAVNCRDRQGAGACGCCISCKKLVSGNHPDYLLVEPEKGAIKIDQVRKVCRELSYPPYESETRVVVLEDVHAMRREASNSLLKTLEEPPANNILILTADSSSEVLTTITSRCQVIPFFGLTGSETAQILGEQLFAEQNREDTFVLSRLAEGSPGKAMMLATTGVLEIWHKLRHVLLGPDYRKNSEVGSVLGLAEELASLKDEFVHILAILRFWIRDHLFVLHGVSSTEDLLPWGSEERDFVWSSEGCYLALDLLEDVEKKMVYNCNLSLMCEVLLFRLLSLR